MLVVLLRLMIRRMMAKLIHDPLTLVIATRESPLHILPLLRLLVQEILFFRSNSSADDLVIAGIGTDGQHSLNLGAKPMYKPMLLRGIGTDMFWCILGQMVELSHIFYNTLATLLQPEELFQFHLHHTLRDMVCSKSNAKGSPWNLMSSGMVARKFAHQAPTGP